MWEESACTDCLTVKFFRNRNLIQYGYCQFVIRTTLSRSDSYNCTALRSINTRQILRLDVLFKISLSVTVLLSLNRGISLLRSLIDAFSSRSAKVWTYTVYLRIPKAFTITCIPYTI